MFAMPLEKEIRAYEAKREELERRFDGKFVVFYRDEFIGPFDTLELAAHAAARWHSEGPYLIRRVGANELQDLVEQITPDNCHKEVTWGKPRGKEIW